MNRILLALYHQDDLAQYRRQAERVNGGLELHAFADPAVLAADGDLARLVAAYERGLEGFDGPLGFHGAFYDMVSASVDPDVASLTLQRYRQNLHIASRLKGEYVVFHANYMGGFKLANYRPGWHRRQVAFWRAFMEDVTEQHPVVLVENMWADEPSIIASLLEEVAHPQFRACLDIAHVALYSQHSIYEWIDALEPYLYCCHLNNHDGQLDLHWPLNRGVIDYPPILATLRRLRRAPLLVLELPDLGSIEASLPLLGGVASA